MELLEITSAIESLLFVSGEALSVRKISNILEMPVEDVKNAMALLLEKYDESKDGFFIIEVNQSYQFATSRINYEYVQRLCKYSHSKGLTKVTAEVLAIIAYKQPITKFEIDQIRGVKSDKPLQHLLDRDLIKITGRLNQIGRPHIYGTTEMFLKAFGLKSIKSLPDISNFEGVDIFMNGDFTEDETTEIHG
jgi:segregation and condensation protein B